MVAKKTQAIDEIDELEKMFQAMAALGISWHVFKSL